MEDTLLGQLDDWGYGSLVARETLKDELLNLRPPLTEEQKSLAKKFFLAFQNLTTQLAVQRWLLAEGVGEEELQRRAERQLSWQMLCEQRFRSQVSTLFLKRKSQLDKVVFSLIWVDDEPLAHEIFLQLSEQESSFDQLWNSLPKAPWALSTCKQGPTPLGELPEALAELFRVSTQGHIWTPRPAEDGWVILRLDELQPAVFNQEHRRDLALELGDTWLKTQISEASTTS